MKRTNTTTFKTLLLVLVASLFLLSGCEDLESVTTKNDSTDQATTADPTTPPTTDQSSKSAFNDADLIGEEELKEKFSDPNLLLNRSANLVGRVMLKPRYHRDGVQIYVDVDLKDYEMMTIVEIPDRDFRVSTKDYVRLSGKFTNVIENESLLGSRTIWPEFTASKYEKLDYEELYPLIAEVTTPQTQTQHGYSLTITKVELTENATKVFLELTNKGTDKFNLQAYGSSLMQGQTQYEIVIDTNSKLPKPQTDVRVGMMTQGVFLFPPIKNEPFTLAIAGRSGNYEEKFSEYTFELAFDTTH